VERMAAIATIAGAITAVAAAVTVIWKVVSWVTNWTKNIVEGIRCQLRTDMLKIYYKNKDTKTIRQYELQNFEANFAAYRALKGNSFIVDIHNDVVTWTVVQ
jgi:hypothetical protein